MRALVSAALVAIALVAAPASARTELPIFDTLEGQWMSEGVAFGKSASSIVNWDRVPGGAWRFEYRVKFRPEMTDGFQGVAYFRPKGEGKYAGAWADSQGNHYPIEATEDGVTLTSDWGGKGRSTYELTDDGSLMIVDAVKDGAGWKEFNRQRFSRQGE